MQRRSFLRAMALGTAAVLTSRLPLASHAYSAEPNHAPSTCSGNGKMQLSFRPYTLQLRHAFNLARYQRTTTPGVQVTVQWQGMTGYGEASMPQYLGESIDSVQRFLAQVDLSRFATPFLMDDIHQYLDTLSPAYADRAAKAAVDIALHDLTGKLMGQPWYRIWGLNPESCPHTSFTIGIDTPDVVRTKVEEASPYRVLKLKMGLDNDRQTVEVVRSMTQVPICVDVNQGWSDRHMALDMCHWLHQLGCLFVEQPFDKSDLESAAWLTQHSPIPVIADEACQRLPDIKRLEGTCHGINIKLMKCTGMHEAYQMATMARALGLKVMLGCMTETSCAVTAMSQLAPMAHYADLDGHLLITNDLFSGMQVVDGRIKLPDAPGIGITPNH